MCGNTAALWSKAISFLHTNKTLKSLIVSIHQDVTEEYVAAFRIAISSMLRDNALLESLSIESWISRDKFKADEYLFRHCATTQYEAEDSLSKSMSLQLQDWKSSAQRR
jgi:hypothetical protein